MEDLLQRGERVWAVLPFHSFLAHERATRPSEDYTTYRMIFFSSAKDYKTLHEVSVCFTPASNGKYGLQPSVPRLITATLGDDKWVCVSSSFLKDSLA